MYIRSCFCKCMRCLHCNLFVYRVFFLLFLKRNETTCRTPQKWCCHRTKTLVANINKQVGCRNEIKFNWATTQDTTTGSFLNVFILQVTRMLIDISNILAVNVKILFTIYFHFICQHLHVFFLTNSTAGMFFFFAEKNDAFNYSSGINIMRFFPFWT